MIRQSTERLICSRYLFILIAMFSSCSLLLACRVDSVDLYVGNTATAAEEDEHISITIPVGFTAYFYATCEVIGANPDELDIKWEFDLDGNGSHEDGPYSTPYNVLHKATSTWYNLATDFIAVRVCIDNGKDEWTYSGNCEVNVVEISIASLDRVPPSKTESVVITVSPTVTTSDSIDLEVSRFAGAAGSATVSPSSIQSTTTVTITGGDQTSAGEGAPYADNLSLLATIGGCDLDSESFTVCAHVADGSFEVDRFDALLLSVYYGMEVFYIWESDSGTVGDLDECWMHESFANDFGDTPPFTNPGAPPVAPEVAMGTGSWNDIQGYKKTGVSSGPAGTAGWDMKLYSVCNRCGSDPSLTDNCTTFVVRQAGTDWWIDTEVTHTCPGPTCLINELIP